MLFGGVDANDGVIIPRAPLLRHPGSIPWLKPRLFIPLLYFLSVEEEMSVPVFQSFRQQLDQRYPAVRPSRPYHDFRSR
jgi:hypothetical protein